jgi:hydrogenase nickel incorporation protein HypA/HybF
VHEAGVMQTALDQAVERMASVQATRIHRLTFRIGAMSGVAAEALEFAFAALTPDTPAEGASLAIEMVPTVCFCGPCGREFRPRGIIFACPACGEWSSEERSGRELELVSVEVS